MRIDEIETRKAEIATILNAEDIMDSDVDIDALGEELRTLNTEAEKIKADTAKLAELRNAVKPSVVEEIKNEITEKKEERKMYAINSAEYRSAFMKALMGKDLTVEERTGMDSGTSSGGYAVPETTLNKIIENLVQIAPLTGEVDLMHIPGNMSIAIESSVADAAIHTENAAISASQDALTRIQLGGYEVVKTIQVSAKLALMSIDAFENWLVSNLTRKIAEVVENYIVNGTGSSQPKGFDKLTWTTSGTTQNAVDWASTAPTVAELETQMGLLNGAYLTNAKWFMSWSTFMTYIHTLRDDKKEQVFERQGQNYYVFGFPVVFSSKCAAGSIYFGDLRETVKANFAQDITVESDRSAGFTSNSTIYRGACMFDCNVVPGRLVKSAASFE